MIPKKAFKKNVGGGVAPYYKVAGLPGPPTFTYQGTPGGTTGGTSSFTISTGTASANRLVVCFVEGFSSSGATISSVLIDGAIVGTATPIFNTAAGGQNVFLAVVTAPIPTGTSSTMVVTWSSAQSGTTRAPTWTTDITTLSSVTPTVATGTQAAGTTNTASIAVANSGSVLLVSDIGAGSGSKAFTASTPTVTQRDSFNVTLVGDANSVASGTATANTSWTGSNSDIIGLALFR